MEVGRSRQAMCTSKLIVFHSTVAADSERQERMMFFSRRKKQ